MIGKQDAFTEKPDVWAKLSAPLPTGVISWRIDGKPTDRNGKHFARYVAYIEANTVRERLDSICPGEWDLTLEMLAPVDVVGSGGEVTGREVSFKARLQILGVIREDIGTGRDYKSASTDAFKRAAVRFGIAHELYAYEQNWVEVDVSNPRFPKPVEDPNVAYQRRYGRPGVPRTEPNGNGATAPTTSAPAVSGDHGPDAGANETVACPKCGGRMWDNRLTKRNPKAPDYKCQNRSCDGVLWPPKPGEGQQIAAALTPRKSEDEDWANFPGALEPPEDDLPF
jgi:hypothetical protein